jgi:hypothetical protein
MFKLGCAGKGNLYFRPFKLLNVLNHKAKVKAEAEAQVKERRLNIEVKSSARL